MYWNFLVQSPCLKHSVLRFYFNKDFNFSLLCWIRIVSSTRQLSRINDFYMSKRKLFKVAKVNNVKELSLVVYNVSALVVSSVSVRASSDLLHLETAYCCTVHSKWIGPMGFYECFPLYGQVVWIRWNHRFFLLPNCIFLNILLLKIHIFSWLFCVAEMINCVVSVFLYVCHKYYLWLFSDSWKMLSCLMINLKFKGQICTPML